MNEIEKQFFECFGIEPKKTQQIIGDGVFSNVIEDEYYPEITDRKLLELICIVVELEYLHVINVNSKTDIDTLKEVVLHSLIMRGFQNKKIQKSVKSLFEGEE